MDIMLDLEQLREARSGLAASVSEFEAASDTNDDLEAAVGRPDGRSALVDQVIDFEVAWRDKRGKLRENLTNIKDQLTSIIDGWDEWDTGTAAGTRGLHHDRKHLDSGDDLMRSPNTGHELRQLEGTASDIVTRAEALKTLATTMETTATQLKNIGDSSIHKSKGTDKLAEMASETHADLSDAAVRYKGTGDSLAVYGEALDVAQTWLRTNMNSVEGAENAYQTALADKADADEAEWFASMRATGSDDEADARAATRAGDTADDASDALAAAEAERTEMWKAFDSVFETWSDAYDDAVDGIENAIETADNNDGFWEFVDDLLDVIAIVLVVLSIIALVIGAPLTGLLAGIIFALAAASFLLTALKFAYGRASLSDLAWSAVGLLPFGVGKILSRGVPTLATVVQGGRGAVTAAIRASLPRVSLLRRRAG